MRSNFSRFRAWAASHGSLSVADVRKHFGCSHTTANHWLNRLAGEPASVAAAPATERVLAALQEAGEALTVRAIAARTGLTLAAAVHAVQNLHETNRVRRHGVSRPYSYSAATAAFDAVWLMGAPAGTRGGDLVASVGIAVAGSPRRIAA